jgi:hypothetical protein
LAKTSTPLALPNTVISRLNCDNVCSFIRAKTSVTLKEELRLRVFEEKALRKILGRRREEVTGEWRKLHSEELHDL